MRKAADIFGARERELLEEIESLKRGMPPVKDDLKERVVSFITLIYNPSPKPNPNPNWMISRRE